MYHSGYDMPSLVSFLAHPDCVIERRPQDTYRGFVGFLPDLGSKTDSGSPFREKLISGGGNEAKCAS